MGALQDAMCEYELLRQKRIEENNRILQELLGNHIPVGQQVRYTLVRAIRWPPWPW